MLVAELKNVLDNYGRDELKQIIIELHKAIPKKIRDEKNIDNIINNIKTLKDDRKAVRAAAYDIDIDGLEIDIKEFIEDAYNQYYFMPNRFVRKAERSKWRFKVKGYIKNLQHCPVDSEDAINAVELIESLYEVLSYACARSIFSTDDPFNSVGIKQTELIDIITVRRLALGVNSEYIKHIIFTIINSNMGIEETHTELMHVFVKHLKSTDAKEIAAEQCLLLKKDLMTSTSTYFKKLHTYNSSSFKKQARVNLLAEMFLLIKVSMCDYEEAITGFKKIYVGKDNSEKIRRLLYFLFIHNLPDYWINEYQNAIRYNSVSNEYLKMICDHLRATGRFPEKYY